MADTTKLVAQKRTEFGKGAARRIRRFHRCHHAIRNSSLGRQERFHGVRHHRSGPQNVSLNRIKNLRARNLPMHVLRHESIGQPGMARHAAL